MPNDTNDDNHSDASSDAAPQQHDIIDPVSWDDLIPSRKTGCQISGFSLSVVSAIGALYCLAEMTKQDSRNTTNNTYFIGFVVAAVFSAITILATCMLSNTVCDESNAAPTSIGPGPNS